VDQRSWRETLPAWLIGAWTTVLAIYGLARQAVLPIGSNFRTFSFEWIGRFPSIIAADLGKLLLPARLSVLAIPEDTPIWPGIVGSILLIAGLFVPGVRRGRLGFAIASLLLLIAPTVPASNLLTLENRLYLPAVAFLLALGEIVAALRPQPGALVVALSGVCLLLGARTWVYKRDFADRMTFSSAAVRESPHSSLAHRNLGVAYQLHGDLEDARREYEAALREDAGEPIVHNNIGVILMGKGQLAEAEQHLRQELAMNPRYRQAHRNLALILRAQGRDAEAAPEWEASLGLGAADREALSTLVAYYLPRDPDRAERFRVLLQHAGVER
jgi:tetratricopeptide (TPR) repeat protein